MTTGGGAWVEARCLRCGEVFAADGTYLPGDGAPTHDSPEDGSECGGQGEVIARFDS